MIKLPSVVLSVVALFVSAQSSFLQAQSRTNPCETVLVFGTGTENVDTGVTVPVRFETYDDDGDLRNCFLPGHGSDGTSNNLPWDYPLPF